MGIEVEQKEQLKRDIEALELADIKIEWDSTFEILRSFTGLSIVEGIKKTIDYWEEFKESDTYKEYWENADTNRYWCVHHDEIMEKFELFIRDKRKNEKESD